MRTNFINPIFVRKTLSQQVAKTRQMEAARKQSFQALNSVRWSQRLEPARVSRERRENVPQSANSQAPTSPNGLARVNSQVHAESANNSSPSLQRDSGSRSKQTIEPALKRLAGNRNIGTLAERIDRNTRATGNNQQHASQIPHSTKQFPNGFSGKILASAGRSAGVMSGSHSTPDGSTLGPSVGADKQPLRIGNSPGNPEKRRPGEPFSQRLSAAAFQRAQRDRNPRHSSGGNTNASPLRSAVFAARAATASEKPCDQTGLSTVLAAIINALNQLEGIIPLISKAVALLEQPKLNNGKAGTGNTSRNEGIAAFIEMNRVNERYRRHKAFPPVRKVK